VDKIKREKAMAIQLRPATDWPVPYIDRATITGDVEGRCGNCRKVKTIRFFYVGRNVAKGPQHGGWYGGNHDMECDECIDAYLSEAADERSVIQDGRRNNA
jgi:hypothetical protein